VVDVAKVRQLTGLPGIDEAERSREREDLARSVDARFGW
jgi:hypothetical protein